MKMGRGSLLLLVLLCCGLAAGCTYVKAEAEPQVMARTGEKPLQIGLSIDSFVIERWIRDRDVFVSAAKELGAEVNVQNANGDVSEQIEQIKYFIKKQMDVIVVVAGDCEALSDVMKKAKDAGIKTMSYDRLVRNADCDMYISFDNREVGKLMAEGLVENIPEGGKIFMIQGPETDHNVAMVREGFESVIKGKNLEVVYQSNCQGWLAEHAFDYAKEALEKYPDVKGIMCGNDDLATQVFRALSEDRMAGRVCLVGQDGDLMACQRIVEGTQNMTAFKSVEEEARIAAEYAVKLGKGESLEGIEATIDDGTYDVPSLELKPVAVTGDNMDSVVIQGGFHLKEDVYLNVKQ
ncbi:substrate-binding domain-containing protein [Lacrimispora saccharolytica]|uniref:Periplasmic binding protein/LacI transcriptional regulator n=1 Tax=Lacrimispora saccharolytica (strain ATCC 35040 / DSM 2544 / NRCC 2533 / WM1) TaxID=610130 RepID=D9R0A0_LACSW|nr:substrate-binding domain-containing protein [Lacrimispora saccharolytica]ADL06333.1 periplasmic binding protein/LacI transcriptional regulator [[Clostridium] saccharolyticum WM1]QRV19568.1 substrate-binding domain-containing protein [Lacrimispora saccharolytica]